ncbi:MAG: hypothetical protein WCO98_00850, partial [bacterium]
VDIFRAAIFNVDNEFVARLVVDIFLADILLINDVNPITDKLFTDTFVNDVFPETVTCPVKLELVNTDKLFIDILSQGFDLLGMAVI